MQRLGWYLFSALSIVMIFAGAYLTIPQTLLSLDDRLRDFLFMLRGPEPAGSRIVIIDIDEKSLHAEGQWPWSRNRVAELLEKLSEAGAGIIGLDIVFSEADRTSPRTIAASYQHTVKGLPDYDAILAATIARTPTIGGYFFNFEPPRDTRTPYIPAVLVEKGGAAQGFVIEPSNLVLNIPPIQDACYSSGFFNNTPDEGGVTRRVPLLMRYEGMLYPSLALEMVRIFTGADRVVVTNSPIGVQSITMGDLEIPTDRFARLPVNFRGGRGSFPYLSATDILHGRFDPREVAGKFVLIGTSAVGLADLRATPMDTVMPGVEVHANLIDNLLEGRFITISPHAEQLDLLMIFGTAAIAFALLYFANIRLIIPLFALLLYGYYRFYMQMLFDEGVILNIIFPLSALLLSFMSALLINYLISSRQKQQLMTIFAKKVSKGVMNDLIQHPTSSLLAPRNREVTIFFSDIRSFTAISERLDKPERVIAMLNRYMTPMVTSVMSHQGTVDKFIGDAIMAYWNAPVDVPDHADKAVASALEQLRELKRLNRTLLQEFDVSLSIGIGIHTGEVTLGEMGSSGRADYTIIGDNVNLASRIEGLCKTYGASLIISAQTKAQLKKTYPMRYLDRVRVKGKEHPVEIYELFTEETLPDQDELALYDTALALYREDALAEARERFETLESRYPAPLYTLYAERCRQPDRL